MTVVLLSLVASCGSGSPARSDGGRICEQLSSDYQAALSAASACTPGAPNQCQAAVPVSFCAGCDLYVNDGTQAIAIRNQFFDQGCDKSGPTSCSFVACLQAGPFTCLANDGGSSGGVCSISTSTTN